MLIRTTLLSILCFTLITSPLKANDGQPENSKDNIQDNKPTEEQHLTYDQMTELMVSELHLNEKQQTKLTKINRRFKNLIEGDHRQPPMMGERPDGQEGGEGGMQGPPSGGMGGGRPSGGMMGGGPSGGMGGGTMGGGPSGMGGGTMGGGPSGMGGHGGMMGGRPSGGPGGMGGPGGGHGGPESYDYDRQQKKYDKAVRKLFNEEQYEGYQKIKPQFYSQRRNRDYLLGNQSLISE